MKWLKKKVRQIRLALGLYTLEDVLHVLNSVGNCTDRSEYEFKVKSKLFKMLD